MIRRQKTSILLDAKENTTVRELKKVVAGILKVISILSEERVARIF